MEQPQYNLLWRDRMEKEYVRLFADYGYGTTIFSPLGAGLLTGKYNNGIPADSRGALQGYEWLREKFTDQEALEKVKLLGKLAEDIGVPLSKMAIAWCLKNPNVSTVITGASRVEQMHENMKALDVVEKLTPDVMNRIEEILTNYKKNLNG